MSFSQRQTEAGLRLAVVILVTVMTCPPSMPVEAAKTPTAKPRDVFAYVINEGKVRAPAAAMALIERTGR